MIHARHAAWADRIFHPYVMWLFKRHFHAIRMPGKTPETNLELPLLLLPNHRTWWDGFFVCISGFLIELAGVNTGAIFGSYFYGETLQPTLRNIPIAIGFAWLGMIISSAAISQRLRPQRFSRWPLLMAAMVGSLMVVFDLS